MNLTRIYTSPSAWLLRAIGYPALILTLLAPSGCGSAPRARPGDIMVHRLTGERVIISRNRVDHDNIFYCRDEDGVLSDYHIDELSPEKPAAEAAEGQ